MVMYIAHYKEKEGRKEEIKGTEEVVDQGKH